MKKALICIVVGILVLMTACGKKNSVDKGTDKEGEYVKLGAYEKMEVTVEKGTVSDASVKSYLERLLNSYAPEGTTITYEQATDEYVKQNVEGYDSLNDLEEDVRKQLNERNDYYAENNTRIAVTEKLNEICTVKKIPEGMLDERVEDYERLFKKQCKTQYGMDFEQYLQSYNMTEENFHEQTVASMEESIKTELILQEIAAQEEIEIDEKGLEEFVEQMIQSNEYESKEDLYEDYGKAYIENSYLCNKTLTMLVDQAKVTFVAPGATLD